MWTALLFLTGTILVEMFIIYSILYCVCYKWLKLDKKIGDDRLIIVMVVLNVLLSYAFLPLSLIFVLKTFNMI